MNKIRAKEFKRHTNIKYCDNKLKQKKMVLSGKRTLHLTKVKTRISVKVSVQKKKVHILG